MSECIYFFVFVFLFILFYFILIFLFSFSVMSIYIQHSHTIYKPIEFSTIIIIVLLFSTYWNGKTLTSTCIYVHLYTYMYYVHILLFNFIGRQFHKIFYQQIHRHHFKSKVLNADRMHIEAYNLLIYTVQYGI